MPSFLYTDLTEKPKDIHTIPDVQDYRPFLTKETWSLERIFCRPEPSRYITIVRGPGALTQGQLRSSVICSILSMFMILLMTAGFLIWFGLGAGPIIVFLLIVLMASWSSLRNTYNLVKLGKDLIQVRSSKKKQHKERQSKIDASVATSGGGDGENSGARRTLTWQNNRKTEESEAVYHIATLERHYEATDLLCWLSFIVELLLFFVYPAISLFWIGDSSLGILFIVLSIISNVRWYMNIVTAIEETGVSDFH